MAAAASAMAFCGAAAALLALDVYLHKKYERRAGFNVWGYRGPVVAKKRPDEYRVAVIGGSAAFGYGVDWAESVPALLERKLASLPAGRFRRFTVVNLGYNNEGAFSFKFTLQDYLSLDYDLACLYEGYNDIMGDPLAPNTSVFRHESPIFRLTGYLPISTIILREKAAALTGDINAIYTFKGKTVFHPTLAARSTAEALRLAASVEESVERQLATVKPDAPRKITDVAATGCRSPWQEYCRSVLVAVEFALQHGSQVLVATQPYALGISGQRHREQQHEMHAMLERRFGGEPRVGYVDLGPTVDLADISLSYDRMHLTAAGNEIVAGALVQPVRAMATRRN
jgi:hypothetical protein